MNKKNKEEILNLLNNIFMEAGVKYAKAKMHHEARNQDEEAEICLERIKVCDTLHEILKEELNK